MLYPSNPCQGCSLDVRNKAGETPLYIAASQHNISLMRMLLDHGATADYEGVNNRMPLHVVSASGDYECTEFLTERGSSMDSKVYYKNDTCNWSMLAV